MDKLVKRIWAIMVLGLLVVPVDFVSARSLSVVKVNGTELKSVVLAQENVFFSRIDLGDVPQIVKSAVAVKYAAYRIGESYIGSDNTYKLIIENGKTKLTVVYRKSGECIKSDTNSVWKKVVLG